MTQDVPIGGAQRPPPELRRDTIWRDAGYWLTLIGRYLRAEPLAGGVTLLALIGGNIFANFMSIRLVIVSGKLTDALISHHLLLIRSVFASLAMVSAAFLIGTLVNLLARYGYRIQWRAHFTRQLITRWIADDRFYGMQREGRIENPEQRIQEDLYLVAENSVTILPFIIAAFTSSLFSWGMIWKLSWPLSLAPLGLPITIPSALFTACIVAGVLRVLGAHFAGRRITPLEVIRQRLEADFRHDLGEVREFGEAIAFERGGPREERRALSNFDRIRANWWRFTGAQLLLKSVNETFATITRLLPPLLCIGPIADGRMTVGQLTVATASYILAMQVLTIFAEEYAVIAELRASVARIRMFEAELARPLTRGISVVHGGDAIVADDLHIVLPDGRPLLDAAHLAVAAGERVLLRGRSGSGKSTFLRALAGLWPNGSGTIRTPIDQRVHFLPQHPYMPSGTLMALLSYPAEPGEYDRERYADVLGQLSLDAYIGRLHDHARWRAILSPGERQRMAAARALLRRPDVLILDEATSALDPQLEAELYDRLGQALPKSTIISVAHRPSVDRFHSRIVEAKDGCLGAAPDR